ncbi:MAG TPA: hypothetical protein VJA20_00290 [Candidatus Nanoarchaeia archaeon]|nr:hypothetical protein [Candidatus Nanoarchaeia archaeon]
MIDKKDWKIVQKVQKVTFEWRNIHAEISEAMNYFEGKNKEAYKILIKMAEVEDKLAEQAVEEFPPLMFKLKKALSKN